MPKRALIVIDVQNEYFDGALPISDPPPDVSLANVGRAMDAASAAGVPLIVVRHGSSDPARRCRCPTCRRWMMRRGKASESVLNSQVAVQNPQFMQAQRSLAPSAAIS